MASEVLSEMYSTNAGVLTHSSAHDIHYIVQNALLNAKNPCDLPPQCISKVVVQFFKPVLTVRCTSNESLRQYWFPWNNIHMFIRSCHLPGLALSFFKQSFRNANDIASWQPRFKTIVPCIRRTEMERI